MFKTLQNVCELQDQYLHIYTPMNTKINMSKNLQIRLYKIFKTSLWTIIYFSLYTPIKQYIL